MNRLPMPVPGMSLCCPRCANNLWSVKVNPLNRAMAWGIAALFFYVLIFMSPLVEVSLYGRLSIGNMTTGVITLDNLGFWMLAAVVFLTTIFMPLLKVSGTLVVLHCVQSSRRPHWVGGLFALLLKLDAWTMVEVYVLGFIIAYTRLQTIAFVDLAEATIGLGGLMICITAMDAALDPEAIWEKIKKRSAFDVGSVRRESLVSCDMCAEINPAQSRTCLRCGCTLHRRKPDSLGRTWALALGAALLYIPSNFLPVMNVTQLGAVKHYTIFAGIRELVTYGLWPLAAIVFIASIAIPLFKLAALAFMLIQTHRGSATRLRERTRLYHLIDFIGRWSMVDIFMVSILVAVVRFGWIATITPDLGIVCFSGVVILTLLAVKTFDPRLMWDAAAAQPEVSLVERGPHAVTN